MLPFSVAFFGGKDRTSQKHPSQLNIVHETSAFVVLENQPNLLTDFEECRGNYPTIFPGRLLLFHKYAWSVLNTFHEPHSAVSCAASVNLSSSRYWLFLLPLDENTNVALYLVGSQGLFFLCFTPSCVWKHVLRIYSRKPGFQDVFAFACTLVYQFFVESVILLLSSQLTITGNMYAVPVLFTQSAFETPYSGLKNGGISPIAPSISSSASSDVSFGCLDRRDSTSSNVSTAASSTASIQESPRPKHRKTLSNGSISRRLLQKRKTHQPQQHSLSLPTSSPVTALPPSAPVPVASSPSPPSTEVRGSDLVVQCRNRTYNCDRAIMCYHSRWFARVCAIVMSPKSSKGAIDLSADDPCAVAAMMQYCYQLDYDHLASSDGEVPEVATLRSHVNVYMLAERYGVAGLRALAMQKFKDLAATVLDEDGNEDQLHSAIRSIFAPDRIANGDELRRVMVKLCADHVQAFIHDTGKKMSLVYESMEEFPEFRVELFEEMGSRWRC